MVETDWKEILNYSQKELKEADKEKLCESISWMEADDIELKFSDLKSLFRLAQDILKFKSEQVNNLLGQWDTLKRKYDKAKGKIAVVEPTKEDDSSDVIRTLFHQEELIKANKEILDQLNSEIARLKNHKNNLENKGKRSDVDSESSRDALSEINAIAELENEVLKRNKHIRKLLSDVKLLQDENTTVKHKLTELKDKLRESTELIENLTEQLTTITRECAQLRVALGKCEEDKTRYNMDIEILTERINEKKTKDELNQDEVKSKLQQLKETVKIQKNEINKLQAENKNQKDELMRLKSSSEFYTQYKDQEGKIKELQNKLSEASIQMFETAEMINILKAENLKLKKNTITTPKKTIDENKTDVTQASDREIIHSFEKKITKLKYALRGSEEMLALREKELTEITTQLQMLQTDEGIKTLLNRLKNNKRQMKMKDEGVKSLVQEVNSLHQLVNDLQVEYEIMRQKLNIPTNEKLTKRGFLSEFYAMKKQNQELLIEIRAQKNKLTAVDMDNYIKNQNVSKLLKILKKHGYTEDTLKNILGHNEEIAKTDKGTSVVDEEVVVENSDADRNNATEIKSILEENEGLRNSLTEILNYLKDNSTTTSGVLTLECPSLDSLLQSMEARRAAGWFAPHMKTILELRAALGGRDALLTALHESRKETYEVMNQLTKESKKCVELEDELTKIKLNNVNKKEETHDTEYDYSAGEFGPWILDIEYNNIDMLDKTQVQNIIARGDEAYDKHIKHCLLYFTRKFKTLYDNFTLLTTNIAKDKKHWFDQEEKYKAEIEHLKAQINDEDVSDKSPGVVNGYDNYVLKSKYNYLDESYKNIRHLYENIRDELLANKEELLMITSEYEEKIQKLKMTTIDLIEKIRHSVPVQLFWQQNDTLNNTLFKYRNLIAKDVSAHFKCTEFGTLLKSHKIEIINEIRNSINTKELDSKEEDIYEKMDSSIDNHQIVLMTNLLQDKEKEVEKLNNIILELQKSQSAIINKVSCNITNDETNFIKKNQESALVENKVLKERCQDLKTELDNVFMKVQAYSQREISNEKEINMLRHQILDLQIPGQSSAAISRLSNEILLAHLQGTENVQKIENLKMSLDKERQLRIDAEEMLEKQQKVLTIYVSRYNAKFRNMFEIMEMLRHQYQGILPLVSIENYMNSVIETNDKNKTLLETLAEVEDLRLNLMAKHSVYDQISNLAKSFDDECSCSYKMKYIMTEKMNIMEAEHSNKKIAMIDESRNNLLDRYNSLEKTLILINQGFKISKHSEKEESKPIAHNGNDNSLELEEICSDSDSSKKGDATYTLSKSPPKENQSPTKVTSVNGTKSVYTQTIAQSSKKEHKGVQLDEDQLIKQLKIKFENLTKEKLQRDKEMNDIIVVNKQQAHEISNLRRDKTDLTKLKTELETKVQSLSESNRQKDTMYAELQNKTEIAKRQLNEIKNSHINKIQWQSEANKEKETLLLNMRKIESDKNKIIEEYKVLIQNEREEYGKLISDLQFKLRALQAQLDKRGSDGQVQHISDINIRETNEKQDLNLIELQDKCFKVNSDLEACESELKTCKSEMERWKNLASERLSKMEQLSSQLKERHNQEVESYKAENQHWLTQLNETQREHMELRTRLTERKASHMKQMAEKDSHIEHLRAVINNLKTQIMNMQTVISINDPSFDLSAIVEVEEVSDANSRQESDTLELRFESTSNLNDLQDDLMKLPSSSTAIWQEPLIERLRREKQLTSKQNAILRKQIKALAGRERRARLDAQNLKNQVYRISTSGQKVPSAESAALQNKIASLQAQLSSARRDAHSTVALWDKWKRAQQSSDRWQARYEEKCQEVLKLESSLNLAKSAITRLEKEKRMLLSRLSESRNDKQLAIEKHTEESSEKSSQVRREYCESPPPLLAKTLLERVEAQQRRIIALEMAEKGNEPLVSEYEKSLAEITSLKGQVLKLESALLEAQIKSPLRSDKDNQPELEYWRSYCEMLKEENLQLTLKINSLECSPAPVDHQRVNDLQQTVLTLRGLVSKLQADQKSISSGHKRGDSRPTSGRSIGDKGRNQSESYKTEISNLKRSIYEKDLLLEKSKEMLKIAADREEYLLRENTTLRRRLEELSESREFLSA